MINVLQFSRENPKDIANIFKKYYGNTIANTIENLLTEYLVIGKDLIVALKNTKVVKKNAPF